MHYKNILLLACLFVFPLIGNSQAISINTTGEPPHPSAILDISSTSKGMLVPRINAFPANPAEGLLVYREDLKCFFFNNGADWVIMEGVYEGGDAIEIDNNNIISLKLAGQQDGDMLCYNGQEWVCVPKGNDGEMLVMKNGIPTWDAVALAPPPPAIGDTIEGGIVFYVDGMGGGLVAALSDQAAGVRWLKPGLTYTLLNATGSGIGAGFANTAIIVAAMGSGTYAAKAAQDYMGGGFSDWYLPSLAELNLLHQQRNVVGGFEEDFYWSSTETNFRDANCVFFGGSPIVLSDNKSGPGYVRAIRAF